MVFDIPANLRLARDNATGNPDGYPVCRPVLLPSEAVIRGQSRKPDIRDGNDQSAQIEPVETGGRFVAGASQTGQSDDQAAILGGMYQTV